MFGFNNDTTWWRLLKLTRDEMNNSDEWINQKTTTHTMTQDLYHYVLNQYGVKIHFTDDGQINSAYTIIDEGKHLLWLLKFSR